MQMVLQMRALQYQQALSAQQALAEAVAGQTALDRLAIARARSLKQREVSTPEKTASSLTVEGYQRIKVGMTPAQAVACAGTEGVAVVGMDVPVVTGYRAENRYSTSQLYDRHGHKAGMDSKVHTTVTPTVAHAKVAFVRFYTPDQKGYATVQFVNGKVARKSCNRILEQYHDEKQGESER